MERHAAWLEGARTLEVARLDLERIEPPVTVGIDPSTNRIAVEAGLDPFGPRSPVGVDAPMRFVDVIDQDPGGLRLDDDLHRPEVGHHRRHAGRQAARAGPEARATRRLIGETLLEFRL